MIEVNKFGLLLRSEQYGQNASSQKFIFDITLFIVISIDIATKVNVPKVPIRLRHLAKNNAVEYSIRMMQLTRFRKKLLRQVAEDFSALTG